MPPTPRTTWIGKAALLLGLAACSMGADASVFKTTGNTWSGWVPLGGLPWERAYQTEMVVNGKRVEMQVYSTRYTEPVVQQLEGVLSAIGATVQSSPNGEGGIARLAGKEVKYAIVSPPSEPRHYIFLSYADPNGVREREFPVPLYPNGSKTSSVYDTKIKADFATVKTTDTPVQVHSYYEEVLSADGWTVVKPYNLSDGGEDYGLAVYRDKNHVCFINVVPGRNISSTVTILVEKGK